MKKEYGHFDDGAREFVITDPLTPSPWINYLSNTRLTAFISQQAGGVLWYREPQQRRITRYYTLPAPGDRPGFYLYVRDEGTGTLWNPHYAPTCTKLDFFEARHGLGYSRFVGEKDGIRVSVKYFIHPSEEAFVWDVSVENVGKVEKKVTLSSYVEFGILEFARELYWCYLKNHIGFTFDPKENWVKYDYHVFEAPFTPAMFFSSTRTADGFDCSREAFCGRGGSLERPAMPLSGSEIPGGGHGCGAIGHRLTLSPGASESFGFTLGLADTWEEASKLNRRIKVPEAVAALAAYWDRKTGVFQVESPDPYFNRCVNVWSPLNCQVTMERTRDFSTDHVGVDGMRFRDTMQDTLAGANFAPELAEDRIRLVLASQAKDGSGNFNFYPYAPKQPTVSTTPHRCDNTVWPIMSVANLINETGNVAFMEERIPYRDGGDDTVYGHIVNGLKLIWKECGPTGLPTLFHADWNDGLAVFMDEEAESVMLGLQMIYALKLLRPFAERAGRTEDVAWCDEALKHYDTVCNSERIWDGKWYRRLLLKNGIILGSAKRKEGSIYLEPQVWAVMSGAGDEKGRSVACMDSVHELLDTPRGICICAPPYTGIPNPEDKLVGNAPGTGENGSIFCHANTWAIIAECILGRGDRAWEYYRKMVPAVICDEIGQDQWGREPYVFNSTILGPAQGKDFGKGGIGWLTGTASWMYIAGTHYLLGIRPELDGLRVDPCLPTHWHDVRVTRLFRGKTFTIHITRAGTGNTKRLTLNGHPVDGTLLPLSQCAADNAVTVRLG
ncbi:MAG: hypothetical protein FWF84_05060 [Kiritimatiellaeota bacterium]|nr:hypothetical protein [Kiritimatiellota bacterium]